jgi:hypothetical protein
MKNPLLISLVGWATLGFLILWIIEIQRVSFQGSYWALMLFVGFLFIFLLAKQQQAKPIPKEKLEQLLKPKVKPSIKKKKPKPSQD